ncbi:ATPase synthesis protein 25 mitochondrial [Didymosphaeria variabile]|uniref:ATPase synthesis protein 25 n=1 Tax=Didymosphaeria variabile TaxID=1932322 RepID=A0A9W8XL08_9PLEO|nr:ATPase synthesis protein 25 mitochondrial [Didymosphaeria variabile]KAJ4352546.1 ATPase synthesis protein 25 mitochondrial [Didymosphaeria variabile]
MSLSRAVSSTLRCTACSKPIARAWPRTPATTTLRASWSAQRPISSTTRRCADRNDPAVEDPEFAFLEDAATKNSRTPSAPQSTAEEQIETASSPSPPAPLEEVEEDLLSEEAIEEAEFDAAFDLPPLPQVKPLPRVEPSQPTLPWYLQNRPAPEPTQAAIIPELPPNPPPLLPTLLEYVANTAGMDDLLIYDLRHLDPPAALGSSLIMIICTARSEKHLHVSADRFCRYLRREHHLRANAAGLLGRNELKIKLRRKAKRMKMLANVGGQEPEGNLDDGIRTGWICCTVGKIQAHPEDKAFVGARGEGEGFVGFNDVKPGVNVVVQMFTEEKRAEIDLENLWNGVLKTHARNEGKADEMIKALDEDVQEADLEAEVAEEEKIAAEEKKAEPEPVSRPAPTTTPTPTPTHTFTRPRSTVGDVFPDVDSFGNRQQLRRLHTVGLRV